MEMHSESRAEQRREQWVEAERWLLIGVAAIVGLLLLIEIVGGRSWTWTGFQDNQHLWDWLHLLLLPVVLALLPVLSRGIRRGGLHPRWRAVLVALGVVFVALVVLGYSVPLTWTGFTGNTLWDWLELLLLPVSVSLLPFVLEADARVRRRFTAVTGGFLAVFGLLAIPGYLVPWTWTGVTGNTLWDWVDLLIAPFALPVTVTLVMHESRREDRALERAHG
jgi:hypothetical protein